MVFNKHVALFATKAVIAYFLLIAIIGFLLAAILMMTVGTDFIINAAQTPIGLLVVIIIDVVCLYITLNLLVKNSKDSKDILHSGLVLTLGTIFVVQLNGLFTSTANGFSRGVSFLSWIVILALTYFLIKQRIDKK